MKKGILLLSIFATFILLYNCKKEKSEDALAKVEVTETPDTCPTVSYSSEVQPIFNGHCAFSGCHSAASSRGGVNLSNHIGTSTVSNNRLLGSIKHSSGFSFMPQGGPKLSDADIKLIECWIVNGKPNN